MREYETFTPIRCERTDDNALHVVFMRDRSDGTTKYSVSATPVKRDKWGYRYVAPSGTFCQLHECNRASKKAEAAARKAFERMKGCIVERAIGRAGGKLLGAVEAPAQFRC